MKVSTLVCISTLAAVVLFSSGCKRALPPGAVSFAGSGVALIPGEDWRQIDTSSGRQTACPPVLKGQGQFGGAIIQVYSTAVRADAQSGVAGLRSKIAAMPEVSQDSFKQEDFASDSGVRGIHFSYEYSVAEHGVTSKLRAHNYLFQNKKGHCVGINYVTLADRDSDAVHQMIRKTLILQ